MKLQYDGPMLKVRNQRQRAVHVAGRRWNELHREISALSGRERKGKPETSDAKTRSDDIGLVDPYGGAADIRDRHDLRARAADRGTDREAVWGHGELWERLGESGATGEPSRSGKS